MFIAHLPATWLAFRALAPRPLPVAVLAAGLIGGIAPDIDLLWFYLFDHRQNHHHGYLTHRPALWAGFLLVGWLLRRHRPGAMLLALAAGGLLHMALDSLCGSVAWAWPLTDWARPLITVPARHDWWVLNFLTHWSFAIEVALVITAAFTLRKPRNNLMQKEKPGGDAPGSSIS